MSRRDAIRILFFVLLLAATPWLVGACSLIPPPASQKATTPVADAAGIPTPANAATQGNPPSADAAAPALVEAVPPPTLEAMAVDISPDGRWMAEWGQEVITGSEWRHVWLRVKTLDGSQVWTLVDEKRGAGLGETAPVPFHWSSDDRFLYYTNYGLPDGCPGFVNGSDLYRANLSNGSAVQLIPEVGLWIEISPDETKVAYVPHGQGRVIVRDLASGGEETVLEAAPEAHLGHLVWSPASDALALTAAYGLCGPASERAYSVIVVEPDQGSSRIPVDRDVRLFVTEDWDEQGRIWLRDQNGSIWALDAVTGELSEAEISGAAPA